MGPRRLKEVCPAVAGDLIGRGPIKACRVALLLALPLLLALSAMRPSSWGERFADWDWIASAHAEATHVESDLVGRHSWLMALVERDGFDRARLNALLGDLEPYPKAIRLMNHQAEAKPYHQYRTLFITNRVIAQGAERLQRNQELLRRVEQRFGVPPEVVVALWGIESRFGANTGRHPVLRALFTLSLDYPRRAEFFRQQLRHFLLLCREEGWDPTQPTGSYAGAMGQVQMIPGTMRQYAVDFDGDGHRDVFSNTADVLASIASFLKNHGWRAGEPYAIRVDSDAPLAELISPGLDEMAPWSDWRARGVRAAAGEAEPPAGLPGALIMLEEVQGPRYHMVFNNFRVVNRWNRSQRFAMVVHELSRAMAADH